MSRGLSEQQVQEILAAVHLLASDRLHSVTHLTAEAERVEASAETSLAPHLRVVAAVRAGQREDLLHVAEVIGEYLTGTDQ